MSVKNKRRESGATDNPSAHYIPYTPCDKIYQDAPPHDGNWDFSKNGAYHLVSKLETDGLSPRRLRRKEDINNFRYTEKH